MKKFGIVLMGLLLALALTACGAGKGISGVYGDAYGAYYTFDGKGNYMQWDDHVEAFHWGSYNITGKDQVQIGSMTYGYSAKGGGLKLYAGEESLGAVIFDGTGAGKAPASLLPTEDVKADAMVGTFASFSNPDDINGSVRFRFFADGSYQYEAVRKSGHTDLADGVYTIEGSTLTIETPGYTEIYRVRLDGDTAYLFRDDGIGFIWLKESDTP